jgi:hypothetical protein
MDNVQKRICKFPFYTEYSTFLRNVDKYLTTLYKHNIEFNKIFELVHEMLGNFCLYSCFQPDVMFGLLVNRQDEDNLFLRNVG